MVVCGGSVPLASLWRLPWTRGTVQDFECQEAVHNIAGSA